MIKRINERVQISFEQISHIFDKVLKLKVINTSFMSDGGSTTNYKVTTLQGSFLLKLYPAHRDNNAEIHLMTSLEEQINVSKIHFYDCSRVLFFTDFLISDFIEGTTLRLYVQEHGISKNHAHIIGKTVSIIHGKNYASPHMFDQAQTPVKSIVMQYNDFIKSIAGQHIGDKYCKYLEGILVNNQLELSQVNNHTVRTHGDMNPGNILVDNKNKLWFIDFEYGHATTPYLDFGKLLRKRIDYSHHLTHEVLEVIKKGYNNSLPHNWIHLSMLVDIPALLRMINNDSPNSWRVEYIQRRIKDLHQNIDKFSYTYKPDVYKE